MLKYITRRCLYMIPTLFGIILVTFVLFNVAGGDPAIMKLGKNTSPRLLEDFDIQRGYDKPLIAGAWGTTRAYRDSDFASTPDPWRAGDGVTHRREDRGSIALAPGAGYEVPVAFGLKRGDRYRWEMVYRLAGSDAATLMVEGVEEAVAFPLAPSDSWSKVRVPFKVGEDPGSLVSRFVVGQGDLELASLRLRRRTAHVFDSQLWFYLCRLSHLDFGTSHGTNQKVSRMILDGILPSLSLTVPMFVVGLVVSIVLALVCAFFRNTFIDRFLVVVSVILMSVNYLVWIVLGQFYLGYVKRWFPIWGFESWKFLVLPCLIGVVSGLGANLRFYRTVMLDEMYRDYVRTAFAKGVSKRGVLFRHVLKNAMIPILTSVVLAIPFLYTGSLLLETFFGVPGLGRMAIDGINNADVDVIRALVFVGAVLYLAANLVTDICYAWVDPRVKFK
ncbi:MAG: ABC transporter permease [Lentisphaerae bacterium]|nr:ABC transporter permease [Lentisphaerota bacterium]